MKKSAKKDTEAYADGAGETNVDNGLKAEPARWAGQERERAENAARRHRRTFRRTAYGLAACAAALGIFLFGLPLLHGAAEPSVTGRPLPGLVLTADAADGSPIEIEPSVTFPLERYHPAMNSVPGFPLKAEAKGADRLEWTASDGHLLLWNPPDYKVYAKGRSVSVPSGDTLYWSPLNEGEPMAAGKSTVTVTAYAEGKKIGSAQIEIASDKDYSYSGRLVTLESGPQKQ